MTTAQEALNFNQSHVYNDFLLCKAVFLEEWGTKRSQWVVPALLYFIIYLDEQARRRIKLFKEKIPANWAARDNWDEILLGGKVVERGRKCLEGWTLAGMCKASLGDTDWMNLANL